MSRIITLSNDHILSRLRVHNPPLHFGDKTFSSIEKARYYATLIQDGHQDVARWLAGNKGLDKNPGEIAGWVDSQAGPTSAGWTFRAYLVFSDLVLDQVVNHSSSMFGTVFKEIMSSEDDPSELHFVQCGSKRELIWACGLRPNEVHDGKYQHGHNCYGKILDSVVQRVIDGNHAWHIACPSHLFTVTQPLSVDYTRTLLLLSDSMSRHVALVEGGHHEVLSGGKYEDIARLIARRNFRFRDFRVVVVNCGVNDVQRRKDIRHSSWNALETVLRERSEDAYQTKIIVSDAIPNSDIDGIAKYGRWINDRLLDSAIEVVNWSKRYPVSPFDTTMYDDDNLHINRKGTVQLVKCWTGIVPDLRFVHIACQDEATSQQRNASGDFD